MMITENTEQPTTRARNNKRERLINAAGNIS